MHDSRARIAELDQQSHELQHRMTSLTHDSQRQQAYNEQLNRQLEHLKGLLQAE